MDNETRSKVFNEAIRIGDELLMQAEHNEKGMSWQTISIDYTKDRNDPDYVTWNKSEAIYTGTSGIALFFLELYKQTNNKNYLDAAAEGMRWVLHTCRENPSEYYAFFTGRMGVAYTLLKMFELTLDNHYLEQALEIAEPCDRFLESPGTVDDLIGGTSGTLLGLLHLHAATGEGWLLAKADLFLKHLIDRSHAGPEGLYWDYSSEKIRGLCGFSHGAAGIGFVFLEAGRYLQNDAFYRLAEQAFSYERYFYNNENKNWPDFRKGIWAQKDYDEHKTAYLEGNTDFFTTPTFMNAWCHGAVGIGLSRLRAFELLKKDIYAREAKIAAEKTEITDIITDKEQDGTIKYRTYAPCHGGGGNAEIFLEAYNVFHDEIYLSLAEKVALQALEIKKTKGYISGFVSAGNLEDRSLFMGNAGIGYFYLRLLDPLKVPSILLPKIESRWVTTGAVRNVSFKPTVAEIRKQILQKSFKRTYFLVDKLNVNPAMEYFENSSVHDVCEEALYIDFLKHTLIPTLKDNEQELVSDILMLEFEKFKIEQTIISSSFLNIKSLIQLERASEFLKDLNEKGVLQLKLVLEPDVQILFADWDWHPDGEAHWFDNLNVEKKPHPVLLKADAEKKVIEEHLSDFSYEVLMAFRHRTVVENAVQEMVNNFDSVSNEQEKCIRRSVIEQVKQALFAGFLIENKNLNLLS